MFDMAWPMVARNCFWTLLLLREIITCTVLARI
jgi:hypothetical protein